MNNKSSQQSTSPGVLRLIRLVLFSFLHFEMTSLGYEFYFEPILGHTAAVVWPASGVAMGALIGCP